MESIPKLGPDSGIFVPASTTGAFGGVVESHNVLAQKLCDFQNQLEVLQQGMEATNAAAKEQLAKDEERRAAEASKAAEEKTQLEEKLNGFKAFIEERATSIEEKSNERGAAFTAQLDSQYKSLHHSVEELSQRQAELVSRILPNWESEIKFQVTALNKELGSHKSGCEQNFLELRERLDKTRADLGEQLQASEARLSGSLSVAQGRLDGAEAKLEQLAGDLAALGSRSSNRDAELAEEIASSAQHLEAFVKVQADKTVARIGEEYEKRMNMLESVMKQSDFERLHFQDRATKELSQLRLDLDSLDAACTCRIAEESAKVSAVFDGKVHELKVHTTTAIHNVQSDIKFQEQRAADLAVSLQATEGRVQAVDTALRVRMDEESRRLEQFAKAEAESAMSSIRADEGVRLSIAETSLKEAESHRRQLAARLNEEAEARKAEICSSSATTEKRVAAVELNATARFETIRSSVEELAEEFQGYVRVESGRAVEAARLEALVRALEVRVWPWRNHAKDRQRSQSPGRPGLTHYVGEGAQDGSSDWRYWQSGSPQKPAGPRPFSGSRGRVVAEKTLLVEEKDNSLMAGLVGSPVGPGLTAARATRSTQGSTIDPEEDRS